MVFSTMLGALKEKETMHMGGYNIHKVIKRHKYLTLTPTPTEDEGARLRAS